jgi:hypothetical protein
LFCHTWHLGRGCRVNEPLTHTHATQRLFNIQLLDYFF